MPKDMFIYEMYVLLQSFVDLNHFMNTQLYNKT